VRLLKDLSSKNVIAFQPISGISVARKKRPPHDGILISLFRAFKTSRITNNPAIRESFFAKTKGTIETQLPRLVTRRAQLIRVDSYGRAICDHWTKEIEYFIDSQIVPILSQNELQILGQERPQIAQLVTRCTYDASQTTAALQEFSTSLTPAEFEQFCAAQLQRLGWDARVTTASRDQGVDVVAERSGVRVVLQCKLYSNPVGNKAVQEVTAAKNHERAHYAAVVTNSRYTVPAEQLAATNGVLLLHYSDLARLDEILMGLTRAST
jgi:restriction system protein